MTTGGIFIAVALKGFLLTFLAAKGIIPSTEEIGVRKRQERLMLKAYKQWRKDAGPEAAQNLHATLETRMAKPRKVKGRPPAA